jgi:PAS domain S-box-containing protein
VPHLTFDLSRSPAARKVLVTRRPIAIKSAARDPRVNPHARRILAIASIAYLPLLSGKRSFGLLVLINRRPHAWSREQLALGKHLAACASIAIESSRLLKRLAETESRLRSLIEHIPAIVYTCEVHPPYRAIYIGPQAHQMLGYSPREWMEDEKGFWIKIVHPDDLGAVIDLTEEAVRQRGFATTEYRLLDRQGETRWFRDEAVLVRDPGGEPIAWHGVIVEITGMKKMAHTLSPHAPPLPVGGRSAAGPEPPAT